MFNIRFPTVPYPSEEARSLHVSVLALKEGYELLTGQSAKPEHKIVTWGDLVNLGIIKAEDIPRNRR